MNPYSRLSNIMYSDIEIINGQVITGGDVVNRVATQLTLYDNSMNTS